MDRYASRHKAKDEHPGLYVHIPFCKTKCPYCDFYSVVDHSHRATWAEFVQQEAAFYIDEFGVFDTLYLGGGTPSVLDLDVFQELISGLRAAFSFTNDVEITVELNPDDVSADGLRGMRNAGTNRISLGAQSFHDEVLSFLGRRHSMRQNLQALELMQETGFDNVSIDLMYGFHGQREATWLADLEQALTFRPAHMSCYLLSIESGTPFGRRHLEGRLQRLDEEAERTFYLLTSEYLRSHGYEHYEVSSFARSRVQRSRHNQKYWHHVPYLGLGPAAHSFRAGTRWWNVRSVMSYVQSLREGKKPLAESEELSEEQIRLEALYTGLRMSDGLALSLVQTFPRGDAILGDLIRDGLVRVTGDRMVPTPEGYVVADGLARMFA